MKHRKTVTVSLLLLCSLSASAKDKKKILLTSDILEAQTVLVLVDPDAGVAIDAPMANRYAQRDVERALLRWGRFTIALDDSTADLIITVRKGNGRIAQPTIGGVPLNNRPVIFDPTDSGGTAGGHRGNPPLNGDPTNTQPREPAPQAEVGEAQDTFAVFRGRRAAALDYPPVWRYIARDALRSPTVPAVDEFRKLIAEAEKQQAAKP
ncbi:MAG: hypothetical protein P4L40_19605 [Terracidiphilus sp.]|nr:hypothetical protein [Terracidiphilus sp.]